MLLAFAVVGLVVVFVIAAVAIGRESHRLSTQAPRPVFDLDEAGAWVAEQLPFEVSAVLSHDDVGRILRWNLEHLQQVDEVASSAGDGEMPPSPFTVIGEQETVEAVMARAAADGVDYGAAQVRAVLDAQLAYLDLIGAMGPGEPTDLAQRDGT